MCGKCLHFGNVPADPLMWFFVFLNLDPYRDNDICGCVLMSAIRPQQMLSEHPSPQWCWILYLTDLAPFEQ